MKSKKERAVPRLYPQPRHVWEGEEEADEQSMVDTGLCVLTTAAVLVGVVVAIILLVSVVL
jgi:hypothetical protein